MSSVRGRTAEDFSVSPSTANVQLRTQLLVLSRPWKNVTSNKLESEFLRPKYYRDQGVFETKVLSGPMRVWDRSTTVTRAGSWPTSFGWDGYGNRHSFKSLKEAKWKWANIWSSWQRAPATVSNCFARLDNVRHSDEMRRDQLQVKSMRPRVLSDPVSRPNCTERSGARQLKSFHISRRGKLICHDASGFTVRPVIDRSPLRGRAASASSCELGERRRQVWTARSCRQRFRRGVSWVSAAEDVVSARRGCMSDLAPQHRRRKTLQSGISTPLHPAWLQPRSTEWWLLDLRA